MRDSASDGLKQNERQRIDVRLAINGLTLRLLGAGVANIRRGSNVRFCNGGGKAKVSDLASTIGVKVNRGRRQGPMHDSARVGVGQSVSEFKPHEGHRRFPHGPVTVQDAAKSTSDWEFSHEIGTTGLFTPVVDAEHVRVV